MLGYAFDYSRDGANSGGDHAKNSLWRRAFVHLYFVRYGSESTKLKLSILRPLSGASRPNRRWLRLV